MNTISSTCKTHAQLVVAHGGPDAGDNKEDAEAGGWKAQKFVPT